MLGLGALGQYPLGGGPYGTATITDISWFEPYSDPVRYRRVPRAAVAVNNQVTAFNPVPVVSFGWLAWSLLKLCLQPAGQANALTYVVRLPRIVPGSTLRQEPVG